MKDLLVIVGFSIVIPPNPSSSTPFPKLRPTLTSPSSTTRLSSHFKSPASTSSGQYHSPLLSTVRYDSSGFSATKTHLKYYADLASKLAEDCRFDDFLMIAETVVVSGAEPSGFVSLLTSDLVSSGIVRLIREGNVSRAVQVLSSVHELGIDVVQVLDDSVTEALAIICGRSLKIGNVEEVVKLMEALAGFSFPVKELARPSDIIRICVRKRDPDTAIRYASALPRSHVVFCTIMCEFGKKGDLPSSLVVFDASRKRSKAPNMYAYRTIIDVCGLCGDYLKSRSIFEELLAQKIKPNIYVFNSLMNVNACDLSYIMYIYKQMQSLGVAADTTSYNILLKSLCLAARVDLAQEIYSEVRRLESTGVLKLDVFTYSTIIKVFADAKQWKTAIKIKEDMLSSGVTPNTVTWSSLISACANVGQVEQAIRLFDDMLLAGCEPNSQCCNVLLHACVEACQYDRAFRIFRAWKESGFHKVVCEAHDQKMHTKLGSSSAEADGSSGLDHLKKISFKPTTATYNILMKACGTDYRRAKALMDEMKHIGLSPNHISWSTLINVCGGSGTVEGAMQILSSMREAGFQPDVIVYTTAIKVCVDSRNIKAAFSLFAEMRRDQIKPNLVTYNTLLRARTRYGSLQEVQQCLEVYQDMRKAGYNSNDYYLKQLIEEWCEGVIVQNNTHHRICSINELDRGGGGGGPHSLVLEKVATHLHKQNAESLAIDLQGLTKVEARIVVLAVLRMIKENYAQGYSIRDDLLMVLGLKKTSTAMAEDKSDVTEAIIKLLQNEIGLEVISEGPKRDDLDLPSDPSTTSVQSTFTDLKSSPTRRPAVLQRLKVTRKSLYHWLQGRAL